MDSEGRGSLHRLGRITAAAYRTLLEEELLPAYERLRPGRQQIVFQQDNAPTHTARLVRNWVATQPRLEVLQWASRSPDINPIGKACVSDTLVTRCSASLNLFLIL